jgi:hypothetical protein
VTTTTNLQNAPFLQAQRQFPDDTLNNLVNQVEQAYVDIAQKVNSRTLGIYGVNFQLLTGDTWYLSGSNTRQQSLRQIYQFAAAGNISHGINFVTVNAFTAIYGTLFDGTNYYPLPYVDVVAATNQINIQVTPTNIVIAAGAGAPPIVSGIVVLEWISNMQSK